MTGLTRTVRVQDVINMQFGSAIPSTYAKRLRRRHQGYGDTLQMKSFLTYTAS